MLKFVIICKLKRETICNIFISLSAELFELGAFIYSMVIFADIADGCFANGGIIIWFITCILVFLKFALFLALCVCLCPFLFCFIILLVFVADENGQ